MCGAGGPNGAQHSQNFEAWYSAVPGLKVVMPSNAADAKGLLKAAIRDDDPIAVHRDARPAGRRAATCPPARTSCSRSAWPTIKREGADVTVVAIGRQVDRSLQAAEQLQAEDGISVEVVDPRTLPPLDADTIVESVRRTGRLVVAQEATSPYSFAAEVCALAAERVPGGAEEPAGAGHLAVHQRADPGAAGRGPGARGRRDHRRRPTGGGGK